MIQIQKTNKNIFQYHYPILIDEFIVKYVNVVQEENRYLSYSLNPNDIKFLLMGSPDFLNNIDYAVEYLIRSNENFRNNSNTQPSMNSNISFDYLQNQLSKFNILARNRMINANNLLKPDENDFKVRQIESIIINDQLSFQSDTLIYSYLALAMIARSKYQSKNAQQSQNFQQLNQLTEIFTEYSLQSNFSPFNPKLIQQLNDDENNFNSLFLGIPLGSPSLNQKGIASNGHFLFVLHSDCHLSVFPILTENGGFLSPFMCKLKIGSDTDNVSLSFLTDRLVATTSHHIFSFDINLIIGGRSSPSSESKCSEIQTKVQIQSKDNIFVVTDGIINVFINQQKDMIIATVKLIDSQKEMNKVVLHKNQNNDLYKTYPFDNSYNLLLWPVETNGVTLSFYIKIDQNHILCRQFSLIDGCHLKDDIIETTANISSITYDSINQMHYVAVDNNGQLMIYALPGSSTCCVNPFIFGFTIPDFDEKKDLKQIIKSIFSLKQKNAKEDDSSKDNIEFINMLSSILLSSIFFKKDINTFIINDMENILSLPVLIIDICKPMYQSEIIDKDKGMPSNEIQIAVIQILAILFVINVRHQYSLLNEENQIYKYKFEERILDLFQELSHIQKEYSTVIITFIILSLFDFIDISENNKDCVHYHRILEGLLLSSPQTISNYIIHVLFMNSDKFSLMSLANSNSIFNKYISFDCQLSKVHPNIISFLICHQRCVINEVHRSMKKDHFATSSLIININESNYKTDNEALNNFGDYTNLLVNQFLSATTNLSSFKDVQNTSIYFLFSNYLLLVSSLYNYHEIAQILTPLLFIIQNSIKEFFEKNNVVPSQNSEAQKILINLGLAFGACTGTLIKGGNYSKFDEKYKWLIRPNMCLISHPDLLYELANPATNVNTFLNPYVRSFLFPTPQSDLNGKEILQKIYRKWNFNMNKNLKSPLLELDQLFFAAELYHLNLFEELKEENIDKLRPALQQMMRVRNSARAILRSNNPTRYVEILGTDDNDANKDNNNNDTQSNKKSSNLDESNSDYSPFDLIVVKCKMLLRMISKFDSSNISIAPKLLADFVLSPDQPSALINYISNQQNRLLLTNVGFSLIEAAYSLKIDELFLQVIDTTLSFVVDNFDGLSAIIQYDNTGKSEEHISNFLSRAFESIQSPYLALIVYKLIKSETLPNKIIGKSIAKILPNAIGDNRLFGLCYNRFGYITNIFEDSKILSFVNSKSENKISLMSLSVDDFNKISKDQWFIISNVLSTCPNKSPLYQKILQFFLNHKFNIDITNQAKLNFVSKCIFSFYERFDESYSLENVKNDFVLLLNSLGRSLVTNDDLERASEIVTFFRRILIMTNKFTLILCDIFKSYENLLNKPEVTHRSDYNENICAIFSILGGFVDVIKLNYPVSYRLNRESVNNGIFLDQNRIITYPVDSETEPMYLNYNNIYAEPIVPFNWCMFPDFNFILSFLYFATETVPSQIALIYIKSLSYYLKEETFYNSLPDDFVNKLIGKLAPYMNPFDTIKDTQNILSVLRFKKKIEPLKDCQFSIMSNKYFNFETFLSPVLKLSIVDVIIESNNDFEGYYGIVADLPLEKQFPYALVHAKSGRIHPASLNTKGNSIRGIKSNIIKFSVDAAQQQICIYDEINGNQSIISIPQIDKRVFNFKIFISIFHPCQIKSIKVKSHNSNEFNTLKEFDMNYVPPLNTIYTPKRFNPVLEHPSWMQSKTESELKNILLDDNNNSLYHPLANCSFAGIPLFEMIDLKSLLFHFTQAEAISADLVNSITMHVYSKLITQMATIIMMYLVNNGFGKLLIRYDSSLLIKLFSYLQIPLEPYDYSKLGSIDFPFLFNESILNESSLRVHNQQFDDMEFDMKNCLQTISKIKENDYFFTALKSYIENMGNDPSVHTLRNINLNVVYFDLIYSGSSLPLVIPSNDVEAIIVSTPYFSNFQINKIDRIVQNQNLPIHFPFIFDLNNNNNANISINIMPLKNVKKTISTLMICKYTNHWVFGTSFELLLLLKEYYLLSDDSVFLRKKLVDWLLLDSPFISIFLPKLLMQASQDCFLIPSQYRFEYLQSLLCLSSLISSYNNLVDQNLSIFLFQEKRSLSSNLQLKIASFFPEFYSRQPPKSNSANSEITIQLPDLDIPNEFPQPVSTFMLYKSFITKRNSIGGFPYWEVLPIWLAITTRLLPIIQRNKNKKESESESENNELQVVKHTDNVYEVCNPTCQRAVVCFTESSKERISTNINSSILYASTIAFEDPQFFDSYDLCKPFIFSGPQLFISVNQVKGPIQFVANLEPLNQHDDDGFDIINSEMNHNSSSSYNFIPSEIHDDFVKDIRTLVEQWSDEETFDLLSSIPPFLLQQKSFEPVYEIVLEADHSYNNFYPPRVVLLVTFIVHRINYLNYSCHDAISPLMWNSVSNLISFNEALKQFQKAIVTKTTSRLYINVNRFEAHRIAIEGNGRQEKTIISQMSGFLVESATKLRSPEMIWHVKFINEEAIDVGGPSRELFSEIATSIFEPTSGLFIISPNGRRKYGSRCRDVYLPFHTTPPHTRLIEIDSFHRTICYKAIGVFLGIVMRTGFYQNIPFAPIVWKIIANEAITAKDVLETDQRLKDFFKALRNARKSKDKAVFDEQFNSRSNRLLWVCENWDGSSINVHNPTKSNIVKPEHVEIYISNCIKKRIEVLYESCYYIRLGMCENIGFEQHQFMKGRIISFLTQGSNIITPSQLKKIFIFHGDEELRVGGRTYNYFWEAVERMTNNQRSLLLKFITALTRLPNQSTFKDFEIKVAPLSSRTNCLPQASTCFNTLYLPSYTSSEIAFKMITLAIEACQTMEKS